MRIIASGILSDHMGKIFLQQDSPTSLVPVHRPLMAGMTPAAALDMAFREETGLIVMPVRVTGVFFDGSTPEGELTFCYRCTMRGGNLVVPDGAHAAGFFDYAPFPSGLSPKYRQQVDGALHHPGGPPSLENVAGGLGTRLGRLFGRGKPAVEGQQWSVGIRLVSEPAEGTLEWAMVGAEVASASIAAVAGEPPWITAGHLLGARPSSVQLNRVEFDATKPDLTLVFAPSGNR